jgi:general secretion pathway protein H
MTLIELLVVVAIIGIAMSGAVYGFRAIAKTELRASASKLAGAIRYCFDRSVTTGSYYRIVLDLDDNKYWAERSDDRMYLTRAKEEAPGKGQAFDEAADEAKKREEEKKYDDLLALQGGAAATVDPPPRPNRAKFQTFKDATVPQINLNRAHLMDVLTPRQREPYSKGRAYLYFFPDGHTENAIVRLSDGEAWYSLVVHPLTGRVEVLSYKAEVRATEFGATDDEGKTVVPH